MEYGRHIFFAEGNVEVDENENLYADLYDYVFGECRDETVCV